MSDLAPFVAAALRDKALQDLMVENHALRKQLQCTRRVEITGPNGTPVYARAQFDDGETYVGGSYWEVKFPKGQQLLACPLAALEGIEIWIAGMLKATFAENRDFEASLEADEDENESSMPKEATFYFSGASYLYLRVMIDGWPKHLWRESLQEAESMGAVDLFRHLIDTVATDEPLGKMVTFTKVSFDFSGILGVIESMNLPPRFKTDEERDEHVKKRGFFRAIFEHMRENGGIDDPIPLQIHATSIQDAFYRLGVDDGDSPMFEELIDLLIDSRQMSATDEDFEAIVKNMVAITNGTYQASDGEEEEGGIMSE
jgi:hypothetical protein